MNQLDAYLRQGRGRARRIAVDVGVSEPYVSDLRHGKRQPSPAVAQKIEAATGGAVPVSAWPNLSASAVSAP